MIKYTKYIIIYTLQGGHYKCELLHAWEVHWVFYFNVKPHFEPILLRSRVRRTVLIERIQFSRNSSSWAWCVLIGIRETHESYVGRNDFILFMGFWIILFEASFWESYNFYLQYIQRRKRARRGPETLLAMIYWAKNRWQ